MFNRTRGRQLASRFITLDTSAFGYATDKEKAEAIADGSEKITCEHLKAITLDTAAEQQYRPAPPRPAATAPTTCPAPRCCAHWASSTAGAAGCSC
jgi:hypothetical protein